MLGRQNPLVALERAGRSARVSAKRDAAQRDDGRLVPVDVGEDQPAVVAVMNIRLGDGGADSAHGIGDMVKRREVGLGVGLFETQGGQDFNTLSCQLEGRHRCRVAACRG